MTDRATLLPGRSTGRVEAEELPALDGNTAARAGACLCNELGEGLKLVSSAGLAAEVIERCVGSIDLLVEGRIPDRVFGARELVILAD